MTTDNDDQRHEHEQRRWESCKQEAEVLVIVADHGMRADTRDERLFETMDRLVTKELATAGMQVLIDLGVEDVEDAIWGSQVLYTMMLLRIEQSAKLSEIWGDGE